MLVEFILSSSYNCESSWLNMEYMIDTTHDLLTQLYVSSNVDWKTLLTRTKKRCWLNLFYQVRATLLFFSHALLPSYLSLQKLLDFKNLSKLISTKNLHENLPLKLKY